MTRGRIQPVGLAVEHCVQQAKHAIVMGGSMAGLLAARSLAGRFERVTILDRDHFPATGEQRRGVPQGRHTHGLLASGRQVLERWFPGLTVELQGSGAVTGDIVRDVRWVHQRAALARPASQLQGLLLSRPLLEGKVRERVFALPNVQVRQGAVVERLLTGDSGRRVTGIEFRGEGEAPCQMQADLVIDATGRGSKSPEWLEAMGYPKPVTDRVEVSLSYTTYLFRRQPHQLRGDLGAIIPPEPHGKRGGVMIAQEGDRWTVTLISHFGPAAPMDLAGFRAFAATLPTRDIHDAIVDAEPFAEPQSARFPASVRNRYEHLTAFPERYLVLGDAICSFNPIYGQGMSVSALESEALATCLEDPAGLQGLALRFFRRAAALVDIPWAIAVGNDLRIPETKGPRTVGVRLVNWYLARYHRAAHHDAELAAHFHQVANLLAPPPTLMHPSRAVRVLFGLPGRSAVVPQPAAAVERG